MAFDNRGTISQIGNVMQINNALVEDVSNINNTTGFIVISYMDYAPDGTAFTNLLRLNVSRDTAVINLSGGRNCLCDIREGMRVDAVFSPRMTRSIPPQSNAFLIVARSNTAASTDTTTARILSVEPSMNYILTGNPFNINSQTRFTVSDNTIIRNRFGNPISLSDLRPGQTVRIIHANFRTASIPPQTTAFYIQVV